MYEETIRLLGRRVEDRVTGFKGVITSVSFDLYGCVMCVVTPPTKEDGNETKAGWFDVQRLQVEPGDPVMPLPTFAASVREHEKGPAEKPVDQRSMP